MTSAPATKPDNTTAQAHCRCFGLFDAMVLLAGGAVSLAGGAHLLVLLADVFGRLCQIAAVRYEDIFRHWPSFWIAARDPAANSLWYGQQVIMMLLLGLTPAFFVIRLRRPRPPLRALWREPGTAAALAMVFGLFWVTGALFYVVPDRIDASTAAPIAMGSTVAVTWCVLFLSRSGLAEPGWIDRTGCLLGGAAITAMVLCLVVYRL